MAGNGSNKRRKGKAKKRAASAPAPHRPSASPTTPSSPVPSRSASPEPGSPAPAQPASASSPPRPPRSASPEPESAAPTQPAAPLAASDAPTQPQPAPARRRRTADPLLLEIAWEAVNPVGGIYTVIRSKLPSMVERWKQRYCLVGPYMHHTASVEFEPITPTGPLGKVVKQLREEGINAHFGHWLVTGRPRVILLELNSAYGKLDELRGRLWQEHGVPTPGDSPLINDVVAFGYLVERLLTVLSEQEADRRPIIAHFHEWMAGACIPELRRRHVPVSTVFTTHATMLGRYIASNDPWYYDHVPFVNWQADAKRFNIESQVHLERAAAHGAHVLTTVSSVTAFECEHLLGRAVDHVTPNGLNIERFVALHEFQNLHREYKEQIHEFVMGHFFASYPFDLDKTMYVFTSGRYEYRNKGFDLTVEALARLNWRLKQEGSDRTIVAFLITRRPYRGINANVLSGRAIMDELRQTCTHIQRELGDKLFYATATGKTPRMDDLVDDYWRLRLRRTVQAWRTGRLPTIVTHDLEDQNDELLQQLRASNLVNNPDDPVKVVYHPDFINATNPLWGMDYDQFVRGCHVGIFPSYYEPWGYTPLECIARGIPAITSDVSGFGSYVLEHVPHHNEAGLYVVNRRYASFDVAAEQLTGQLYHLASLERRDRIALRNLTDRSAESFDWHHLVKYYDEAHDLALKRAP